VSCSHQEPYKTLQLAMVKLYNFQEGEFELRLIFLTAFEVLQQFRRPFVPCCLGQYILFSD